MSEKLEKIQQLMPLGKMQEVNALVESALQEGISPQEILKGGLLEGHGYRGKEMGGGNGIYTGGSDQCPLYEWRYGNSGALSCEKRREIQWKGGIRNGAGGSA